MTFERVSGVSVIGAGSWGTVVAHLVARNSQRVTIWARDADVVASINSDGVNARFLPNLRLAGNIRATSLFQECLSDAQVVLWAIPVQFTRQRLRDCAEFIRPDAVVVNLGKGLEIGTWYRPSQIILQECSGLKAVGSMGGPNLAAEIAAGMPANATLAMTNHWEVQGIENLFRTESFSVSLSPDLLALELAGALKNVVAIGAGLCDGLNSGQNTKAYMIACGFDEMRIVGKALGANPDSFLSSFGLADMLSTCYSDNSRNSTLGRLLGSGLSLSDAADGLRGRVAEGIATTTACCELANKLGLELPTFNLIGRVLSGDLLASQFTSAIYPMHSKHNPS